MQAHGAAGETATATNQSPPSPPHSSPSPRIQQQQQPFGLNNPNSLSFSQLQLQQMGPLMQLQMGLPFVNPQAMQSLMRNPSPVPNQGFAGGVPGFLPKCAPRYLSSIEPFISRAAQVVYLSNFRKPVQLANGSRLSCHLAYLR